MFTEKFPRFVCVGDTITCDVDGFTITARIEWDCTSRPDDYDCYTPEQKQGWADAEWFFCGVILSISKEGITLDDHAASLWGIECNFPGCDNSHLQEVAEELLSEAVDAGENALNRLIENEIATRKE